MLPGQLMFTGMDTGFLKKGVHMYKGVRGFALLIISHFLKNGGGVGGREPPLDPPLVHYCCCQLLGLDVAKPVFRVSNKARLKPVFSAKKTS